jgi:hypothetical protein
VAKLKQGLAVVAFNEHARAQLQPGASPASRELPAAAPSKPLNRSLDKGLLLLLLAALVAHQLRRNQRLLNRQLTGV